MAARGDPNRSMITLAALSDKVRELVYTLRSGAPGTNVDQEAAL
jgi:hypothetical protein